MKNGVAAKIQKLDLPKNQIFRKQTNLFDLYELDTEMALKL